MAPLRHEIFINLKIKIVSISKLDPVTNPANRKPYGTLWSVCWELSRTLVGLGRFELPTSRLSGVRSNQLSYRPEKPPNPKCDVLERETKTAIPRVFSYIL
jgi:hypothetical protein